MTGHKLAGVVLDCDGTIVDTEPTSHRAWQVVLQRYGYEMTDDDQAAILGFPFHRAHAYFRDRAPVPADPAALLDEKRAVVRDLSNGSYDYFEDALAVIRDLHVGGVPVAVSSSSSHDYVDNVLRQAGVADAVAAVVGSDDVQRHKPDPEPYLAGARALDCDPRRCAAAEDTRIGVEAAAAAGMWVVGVRRPHVPAGHLDTADRVVDTLTVADLVPDRG